MTEELLKQCIKECHAVRLLYVEDNKKTKENTLGMLKRFFTHVKTAEDGLEGIAKFQEGGGGLILS